MAEVDARVYTNQYLTDPNWTSRYIRNRLKVSTLTKGAYSVELARNYYDHESRPTCGGGGSYFLQTIPGSSPLLHDSATYTNTYYYRGNAVSVASPGKSGCLGYDVTGTLRSSTINGTSITITTQLNTNYAAPSQITVNNFSTNMTWTGVLQLDTRTGPSGETVDFNYDAAHRPASTTSPFGAVTAYTYSTTAPQWKATTGTKWTKKYMDGFGREVKAETGYTQGSTDTVVSVVETEYEACACTPMGKVKRVSQPHGPTQPAIWTEYVYDMLGRVTQVKPPANNGIGFGTATTYAYAGNIVTVTEPGGRWKRFTTDAFGNLTRVDEPKANGVGEYATVYQYTPLNQLTNVNMTRDGVTQTRTFTYDSAQRLWTTTFPENGTTTYTYNANGQLTQKQDAKGQKIRYEYEQYQRLKVVRRDRIGYPDHPNERVTYHYDFNPFDAAMNVYTYGRLAAVEYGTETQVGHIREGYKYNLGGGITLKRMDRAAGGWRLEAGYTYDNEGRLVTLTYPNNGKTYTTTYDLAGRPSGMTHQEFGTTVNDASGVTYNAAGQLTALAHPAEPGFNYSESFTYNGRNQLTNLTINKVRTIFPPGTTPVANLTYTYPATNAGRIDSMTNAISGETVSYEYDQLSRLMAANAQQWTQAYTYDPFGNLYKKTGTGLAAAWSTDWTASLVSAKNQIGSHDANGNPVGVTFDVENRLTTATTYQFGYAPDNKRVVRVKAPFTGSEVKEIHFYSGNQRLGAYKVYQQEGEPGWFVQTLSEERYFAGRRLTPQDRLGSAADARLLPYGEELSSTPNDRVKFATYVRDDWGYDYADQRNYSQGNGRFLTPDPYMASGGVASPSSWNRYAYVEGDPVNKVDPAGLIATRVVCTADLSSEECFGQSFGQSPTGNGNGGMYCDQAKLPFISTPAECAAYSHAAWFGLLALAAASSDDDEEEDPECFARLKDRDVEATSLPGVHTFWWVQSRNGNRYIIAGGPKNGYLEGDAYSGDSTKEDSYKAHTDWDSGLSSQNCDGVDRMITAAQNFPEAQVRYHFLGPNSNSFARHVGVKGGFTPSPPFTAWGWNYRIPGVR
jgi:RHS repeat-associated protein